jgi:hypothetical protein
MEEVEGIQRQYLRGVELQTQGLALQTQAFNRLLALQAPVVPVGLQIQVERITEA